MEDWEEDEEENWRFVLFWIPRFWRRGVEELPKYSRVRGSQPTAALLWVGDCWYVVV